MFNLNNRDPMNPHQAAQECAEEIVGRHREGAPITHALITPIIAAAMREVCEPLERQIMMDSTRFKEMQDAGIASEVERDQLRARVAEMEADKVRLIDCINEVRRHMHEPHGGHIVGDGGDSVSREKKMMFHSANKALDAAIDAAKGRP